VKARQARKIVPACRASFVLEGLSEIARGFVDVANPEFAKLTDDAGNPLPWHPAMRTAKDATLTAWVPMGVCGFEDGGVYVLTIAPFTLVRIEVEN